MVLPVYIIIIFILELLYYIYIIILVISLLVYKNQANITHEIFQLFFIEGQRYIYIYIYFTCLNSVHVIGCKGCTYIRGISGSPPITADVYQLSFFSFFKQKLFL